MPQWRDWSEEDERVGDRVEEPGTLGIFTRTALKLHIWQENIGKMDEGERVGDTWLSAPQPKSIEEKEPGTVGKIFGIFLTGERASGNVIYAARKKLCGEIEWIEEREEGELFKEISPSQALGLATAETKFLSVRGVASFAADVLLDPTTYVGVGLIGKGAKVGKALKIGSKIDDTLTVVGPKGIRFIEETMGRGLSRKTADKKLLEAIGRGHTEYLAAKKYAESSVNILGQKLFYTAPYKQAALKGWDALPYAQKRAKGVDVFKTAFVPFYKAATDVGEAVKDPFLKFYRQTAYQTSKARAEIKRISKKTPDKYKEEVANILEAEQIFRSPADELAAKEAAKVRDADLADTISIGGTAFDTRAAEATEQAAADAVQKQAAAEGFDTRGINRAHGADAVEALEKRTPPSPEAEEAAAEIRKIYDDAYRQKLALGIAEAVGYRANYMHHAPTKEGRKWLKREYGTEEMPPFKHGPLKQRKMEGDVIAANQEMYEKTGIKEFFVEDPYIATQMYMAKHASQVESFNLHKKILEEYGRPTGAAPGLAQDTMSADGVTFSIFKYGGKETYLPTSIIKELDRTHPKRTWWTDTYDPALGSLKKSWIAMWLGYYARNLYGGVGWQNVLAGVEPVDYARNVDVLYGDSSKVYDIPRYGKKTGAELKELMESHNVYGQTGYVGEPSAIGPLSPLGQIYQKYPEAAMKLSENQLRGPVFLHYLYKTGDPDLAAEMTYKFHFEYLRGTYTAFEEKFLFRAIPFGMWAVGNIPLQAEMAVRQPGKFAALAKINEMGSTPEEYNQMEDWQKEGTTYVHDGTVFSYDLPVTDMPGMYTSKDAYFAINPLLKFGISELIGKDRYGKELAPLDTKEGAIQQAEMAAITFEGRFFYAAKELEKTAKGERPVSSTAIHQIAGVGVHETRPQLKPVGRQAFEAERWKEGGAYVAWVEAGGTAEAPQDTGEPVKISSKYRREEAKVIKVIDGDTIKVALYGRIQTVRYLGIDTPETVHPNKPIQPGGMEASEANKRLVEGQTVYLEKDKTNKDKYDRLLRNVFLEDDTFVNAELVRLGYATESYYKPDKRYKELLEELEAEAPEIQVSLPWGGYGSREDQEYATWVAAGSPEDFHIKNLPGGKQLALRHELYEAAKGFEPTEKQLQYIEPTFPELSALVSPMQTVLDYALSNPPGSREARYDETITEWNAFKSGKMQLEYPTEEQRMESWRRAGLAPGQKYKQEIYRDELGKLLGVSTFTPEEIEEMGAWKPSETEAEWAFRDTRKIAPKEQFKIWAQEHEDELLHEEALKEEYASISRGIIVRKGGDLQAVRRIGGSGTMMRRRRELEEMLGEGVDR